MAKNPFLQLHVYRNASQKGKRVTDCYRLLYKEELWMQAASNLRKKQTKQVELALRAKINRTIDQLRAGTFRFMKRQATNKQKQVNLRIEEELLQEVIRIILNKIYQPISCKESYGFREKSTEHTALMTIKKSWRSLTWCLQGSFPQLIDDIKPYVLLKQLARKINDRQFLLLLHHILTNRTVISDRLAHTFVNIYLHEFDSFIQEKITAANQRNGLREGFKYVRYNSEFVIGIASSKKQALCLQETVEQFLTNELQLKQYAVKINLIHLERRITFLQYTFRKIRVTRKKREQAVIILEIPQEILLQFVKTKGYGQLAVFKMTHRSNLLYKTELEILKIYNRDLKRLAHYYQLADNHYVLNKIFFFVQSSFIKTIANKRRTSSRKVTASLRQPKQGRLCLSKVNDNGVIEHIPFVKLSDFSN